MKSYFGQICLFLLLFLAVMTLPVAYAQTEETPEPQAKTAEKETQLPENAAMVNGKAISYDTFSVEVEMQRRRLQQQGRQIPDAVMPRLRAQVLESLINEELLYQEALKKKVIVPKEDIDQELAKIKKQFKTQEEFEKTLGNMHMSEADVHQQLLQRAMIQKLLDAEVVSGVEVKDSEVKSFYGANPKYFQQPEQIHARHILIKVGSDADDAEKAEARKKIDALKKRLDTGEDFGELARVESEGPSSTRGGDLGFFGKGQMVKPFEDAAFALKKDQISDVVQTQFGYHLIQKLDHKDARTVPFEEAKARIVENLRKERIQKEIQAYVTSLHKTAKIERFLE